LIVINLNLDMFVRNSGYHYLKKNHNNLKHEK
jgi:hypothetical protein